MGTGLAVGVLLGLLGTVHAQDVLPESVRTDAAERLTEGRGRRDPRAELPWYVGQTVGLVSLVAADGGLPPEYLQPLLHTLNRCALSAST